MAAIDEGRGSLLAAAGGSVLVPYALLKGPLAVAITATETHLPGLSAAATALLVHLLEGLLVALVVLGVHELAGRARGTTAVSAAYGVALAGAALLVGFHAVEHVVPAASLSTPVAAAILWGYYVGWPVFNAGQGLVGVAAWRAGAVDGVTAALLAALFPVGLVVGLAVVTLDAFTFAGTQRLLVGAAWTVVGARHWARRTAAGGDPASSPAD